MDILLGKEICRDLNQAQFREWLETNGIGGYASSTVVGMNTRRYHGLLVPAAHPPVGRFVALSSLQEVVRFSGLQFELGCNHYRDVVHPQGYRQIEHFRLDPFPVFNYRLGDLQIEKRVFMVHGENTTVVRYGPVDRSITLEIRPLLAFRDYHNLAEQNDAIQNEVEIHPDSVTLSPYEGMSPITFLHNGAHFHSDGNWYYSFHYPVETYRGLNDSEDLYAPGFFTFDLEAGATADLVVTVEDLSDCDVDGLESAARERRRSVVDHVRTDDTFEKELTLAADAYIVKRDDDLATVIAGYPWFSDWGRDTFIALPGLTLVTGRIAEARAILQAFARVCDAGMIPNRFPDHGETPDYNSVDASLWYIHAAARFLDYTNDLDFVRTDLWPVIKEIVDAYAEGTRYNIHAEPDGLIWAGEPGVQLTWMDAKVDDWVVTPRIGKPVEINALWYHALRFAHRLAQSFDDPETAEHMRRRAEAVHASFGAAFWNDDRGCLFDVVDGNTRDGAVRPNQIFALSLPDRLLSDDQERSILSVVESELLTPVGLRSLSPDDPAYQRCYGGDPYSRDGAYHQGTVWGWLLGPFISAWVRLNGGPEVAGERAMGHLLGTRRHLYEAGLGQISEVFDGASPHTPRGCYAQAWSVAESLRAYVEDIQGRRPKPPR